MNPPPAAPDTPADERLARLHDCLRHDPDNGPLQAHWLRSLHHQGRLAQACAWIAAQAGGAGLQPAARGVASLVALDAGQLDTARTLAEGLDDTLEALATRASLALLDRDAPQAQRLLDRANALHPHDSRCEALRALACLQAHELPAALAHFERALHGGLRAHVGSWLGLGWTCLLRGDRPAARAAFGQALALDGRVAATHGALALLLALEGEADAAQHHLRVADKLDPAHPAGPFAHAALAGEPLDAARLHAMLSRLLLAPEGPGGVPG